MTMLGAAARWMLPLAALALVLGYGGKAWWARPLASATIIGACIALLFIQQKRLRYPGMGPLLLACLPLVAVPALQWLPLGWWHPWLTEDRAVLSSMAAAGHVGVSDAWLERARLTLDLNATFRAWHWHASLAAALVVSAVLLRGERARAVVTALVVVGAIHGAISLLLAPLAPDFPSDVGYSHRVRGTFVYPNQAGAFWACLLPLAICWAVHGRGDAAWKPGWHWAPALVLAASTVLSASRGALAVALLINIPLLVALLPAGKRLLVGAAAGVVGFLLLSALNLDTVSQRIGDLDHQGGSLNRRTLIWEAAWPFLTSVPALGAGADTTPGLFLQSGLAVFEPTRMRDLHSDILETWLEWGWAGALALPLCGALGWAWWLRRPLSRVSSTTDQAQHSAQRLLALGAVLGLAHLLLHGASDHIIQSEALALLAVLLIAIAIALGARPRRSCSIWPVRIMGLAFAIGLASGLPWLLRNDFEIGQARLTERRLAAALGRQQAPEPDGFWQRISGQPATSQRFAISRTRLGLSMAATGPTAEGILALTAVDLDQHQGRAPADPDLWAQRARWLIGRGDHAGTSQALTQLRRVAPAWRTTQDVHLAALDGLGADSLEKTTTEEILRYLLRHDGPRPDWFAPLAGRHLGTQATAGALEEAGPQVQQASLGWLARAAPREAWLAIWQGSLPNRHPRFSQHLTPLLTAHPELVTAGRPIPVGGNPEARRQEADLADRAGLDITTELSRLLQADGSPWSLWARGSQWSSPAWRSKVRNATAGLLNDQWAIRTRNQLDGLELALAGDGSALSPNTPLHHLAVVIATDPDGLLAEQARGLAVARPLRWHSSRGYRSTEWWQQAGGPIRTITLPRWTGVILNGEWRGWQRGIVSLGRLCERQPGHHRLILVTPP